MNLSGRNFSVGESLYILYVEDHADTRQVFSNLLTRWGHKVSSVSSAASARNLCKSVAFDVLISDVGLEYEDGTELVKVRPPGQKWRRAIALTAYGMAHDIARFKEAGFDEVLIKPVTNDLLQAAINRVPPAQPA